MPAHLGRWIFGALAAICGLAALYVAAHATEKTMHYTAMAFFIGCVLFIFGLIKNAYDQDEHD